MLPEGWGNPPAISFQSFALPLPTAPRRAAVSGVVSPVVGVVMVPFIVWVRVGVRAWLGILGLVCIAACATFATFRVAFWEFLLVWC